MVGEFKIDSSYTSGGKKHYQLEKWHCKIDIKKSLDDRLIEMTKSCLNSCKAKYKGYCSLCICPIGTK